MTLERVFLFLLNASVTALWAVLAVLALRLLLRRAPRRLVCLLWAVPALRLLLPVSIESVLSLIPSAETLPQELLYAPVPAIDSNIPALDGAVNPVLEATMSPAAGASVNPMQLLMTGLGALWLLGLGAMLALCLVSALRLRGRLREAVWDRENIWRSDRVETPFVLGLARPRIYLPFALEGEALELVLAHERAHIRAGDHWFKLIGWLLLSVYWFNPALWLAYVLFCRDLELSCDERVITGFDEDRKRAYSRALLGCASRGGSLLMHPLAFGELGVKERIKKVLNFKRPAVVVTAVAALLCVVAALCLLTDPKEDAVPADAGAAELSAKDETPGLYLLIDREGVYRLDVSCDNAGVSGGCINADGTPFKQGELVCMEPLSGITGANLVLATLIGKDDEIIAKCSWELELDPETRTVLELDENTYEPPEDLPFVEIGGGEELEKLRADVRTELKRMYDIGLISVELTLDGERTQALLTEKDYGLYSYSGRVMNSTRDFRNSGDKYYVSATLDNVTGKLMYVHIEAVAAEDAEPVPDKEFNAEGLDEPLRYYENFVDIFDEDMTLDRFCELLSEYWGFAGYTIADTVDGRPGFSIPAPDGGTLLTEMNADSYATVYFDGDQEGVPMFIEVYDFPGRASITFGVGHSLG